MSDSSSHIVVNEQGVFIPREMLGQKDRVLMELDQLGIWSPSQPKSSRKIRHVAPIDLSRERRWLKEHRHEYLGQWVCIEGEQLISHSREAKEVYAAARAAGIKSPFVEFIHPDADKPYCGVMERDANSQL